MAESFEGYIEEIKLVNAQTGHKTIKIPGHTLHYKESKFRAVLDIFNVGNYVRGKYGTSKYTNTRDGQERTSKWINEIEKLDPETMEGEVGVSTEQKPMTEREYWDNRKTEENKLMSRQSVLKFLGNLCASDPASFDEKNEKCKQVVDYWYDWVRGKIKKEEPEEPVDEPEL